MRGSDAADVEAAQAMFELALDHNPREINSLNSLALILQREGHHVEAQGHYNRALRLAPSECALHCNYASFLQSVRKGGALFPEDSFLLFTTARCAHHNDRVSQGLIDRKALCSIMRALRGHLPAIVYTHTCMCYFTRGRHSCERARACSHAHTHAHTDTRPHTLTHKTCTPKQNTTGRSATTKLPFRSSPTTSKRCVATALSSAQSAKITGYLLFTFPLPFLSPDLL